jgi:hypothetical protein
MYLKCFAVSSRIFLEQPSPSVRQTNRQKTDHVKSRTAMPWQNPIVVTVRVIDMEGTSIGGIAEHKAAVPWRQNIIYHPKLQD